MAQQWQVYPQNLTRTLISGDPDIAAVAANTSSSRVGFPIGSKGGILKQVAIHTGNTILFDFRLFTGSSGVAGSVVEIYRAVDVTQFWQKEGLRIIFSNTDTPQTGTMYIELDNRSLVAGTGIITLQLFIQAPGTGRV